MNRELKDLLPDLKGVTENIIAVNLDIRGFSKFCIGTGSIVLAEYIKKIYSEIINRYFSHASFMKTTGDGLLLAIQYTEKDAETVAIKTIESCLMIMQRFSEISNDAAGELSKVPQNIGIGLSRGPACRLVSDNKTVDYSGIVPALASKLVSIARPSGIVVDGSFEASLLSNELGELFEKESVYFAGISDNQPIDIYYTRYFTQILPMWKQPVPLNTWMVQKDVISLRNLMILATKRNWYSYSLQGKPCNFGSTKIQIEYPLVNENCESKTVTGLMDFRGFNHSVQSGKYFVRVNYVDLIKKLLEREVKDDSEIIIRIKYQEE